MSHKFLSCFLEVWPIDELKAWLNHSMTTIGPWKRLISMPKLPDGVSIFFCIISILQNIWKRAFDYYQIFFYIFWGFKLIMWKFLEQSLCLKWLTHRKLFLYCFCKAIIIKLHLFTILAIVMSPNKKHSLALQLNY